MKHLFSQSFTKTFVLAFLCTFFISKNVYAAPAVVTVSSPTGTATAVDGYKSYTFDYDTNSLTGKITRINYSRAVNDTIPNTLTVKYSNKNYTIKITEIGDGINSIYKDNTTPPGLLNINGSYLTKINAHAFQDFIPISNGKHNYVNMKDASNLTTIGDYAFAGSCIYNVIPAKVTDIGAHAFDSAEFLLGSISMDNANKSSTLKIGDYAFANIKSLHGTPSSLNIIIGKQGLNKVEFGKNAFADISDYVTSITINSSNISYVSDTFKNIKFLANYQYQKQGATNDFNIPYATTIPNGFLKDSNTGRALLEGRTSVTKKIFAEGNEFDNEYKKSTLYYDPNPTAQDKINNPSKVLFSDKGFLPTQDNYQTEIAYYSYLGPHNEIGKRYVTKKDQEVYIDIINGAIIDGKFCDVRVYPWYSMGNLTIEKASIGMFRGAPFVCLIDKDGSPMFGFNHNPTNGTAKHLIYTEFHFYPAGTLESNHKIIDISSLKNRELNFNGVIKAGRVSVETNGDKDSIAAKKDQVKAVFTTSGTTVQQTNDVRALQEEETYINYTATKAFSSSKPLDYAVWYEVSSTKDNPLRIMSGCICNRRPLNYVFDTDGEPDIPVNPTYKATCYDHVGSSSGTRLGTAGIKNDLSNGITVKGSDWGSVTSNNYYYNGYYYTGSSSATINNGDVIVYRYFEEIPVTYNVSCYDYVGSTSGRYLGQASPSTRIYNKNTYAYGSDWGSNTNDSYYYSDYKYSGCSSVYVTSNGLSVYRYFIPKYKVTTTGDGGVSLTTGGGKYYPGTSVTVNATLKTGFDWVDWTGTYNTDIQQYSFIMPSYDVNLKANTLDLRFLSQKDALYEVTRGRAGTGTAALIKNGGTNDYLPILSLKGGDTTEIVPDEQGACSIFKEEKNINAVRAIFDDISGGLTATLGGGTTNILGYTDPGNKHLDFKTSDGKDAFIEFCKTTIELKEADNVQDGIKPSIVPAIRLDYNNGEDPDWHNDLVFYTDDAQELNIPEDEDFVGWNTKYNGKGDWYGSEERNGIRTAKKVNITIQDADDISESQNTNVGILYAIYVKESYLHSNH